MSLLLLTTTLKFSPRLGSVPAIAGIREAEEAGAANNLRVTAPGLEGNDRIEEF